MKRGRTVRCQPPTGTAGETAVDGGRRQFAEARLHTVPTAGLMGSDDSASARIGEVDKGSKYFLVFNESTDYLLTRMTMP